MKLQDGDALHGRFISPSGREIKSFAAQYPLAPEGELEIHYNGSLSAVAEVFATFVGQKKEILRSIQFDGLLKIGEYRNFDSYFCLWLMAKVETSRCTIRLTGSEEIPIRDRDVGHILGLPWCGAEIVVEQNACPVSMSKIREILAMADKEGSVSMKHIETILTKKYSSRMSQPEIDAFKIAVVLFAVTNIFATGGNPKDIPLGLLKYLTDPTQIHMFNWGLLVRRYFVSWCHFVTHQLRIQQKTVTIGGCFLLPMVAYLDNHILGPVTILHYEFPRTNAYNEEKLKVMIAADTNNFPVAQNRRQFGRSKLKSSEKVFYGRWLVHYHTKNCINIKKRGLDISDLSPASNQYITGIGAKLCLLAANKSMKKEIMSSTGLGKIKVGQNKVATTKIVHGHVPAAMDIYIEASKSHDNIHWIRVAEFFKDLSNGNVLELEKIWVHHLYPFEIKINGRSLSLQLLDGCRYCTPVCDSIIRDQNQVEDKIFNDGLSRKRHLMPASFMESYRDRDKQHGVEQLRSFFIGDHVKYNVSQCIQINMPVSFRRKWSCYSWNLVERSLTVLDPMLMRGDVSIIAKNHELLVSESNDALFSCLQSFFPGYIVNASEWTTIYRNDISDKCKWSDTGLYALHYCLTFNTEELNQEITLEEDYKGRWMSLWKILDIDGNIGVKPDKFHKLKCRSVQ